MTAIQVICSAPGKLMLFGEHAVVYGQPCLVTAVGQRMVVTVKNRDEPRVSVSAGGLGVVNYAKNISGLGRGEIPKEMAFVEHSLKNLYARYGDTAGAEIAVTSEFSSQYGLGSSSAVVVALVDAVAKLKGWPLADKEIFDLAYKSIIDVQGVGSGFDAAAAIFGGTLYFVA